jgi:hypothetical protein
MGLRIPFLTSSLLLPLYYSVGSMITRGLKEKNILNSWATNGFSSRYLLHGVICIGSRKSVRAFDFHDAINCRMQWGATLRWGRGPKMSSRSASSCGLLHWAASSAVSEGEKLSGLSPRDASFWQGLQPNIATQIKVSHIADFPSCVYLTINSDFPNTRED